MATRPADYAPTVQDFFAISIAVNTVASARAAGVGPFAGLFFRSTSSVTVISPTGVSMVMDAVNKNTVLWISGNFVSVLATTTNVFGVI
jgi:hypothetical protein